MKKIIILFVMSVGCFIASAPEVIQEPLAQDSVSIGVEKMPVVVQDDQKIDAVVLPQEPINVKNQLETTFAIIKPDAVAAGYTGQIIDLIEKNGFEIVRMQKKMLTLELAMDFYVAHQEKPFYNDLIAYMSSGPIVILELSKNNAIADWRTLIGATDPAVSGVGTIRKMFGTSKTYNAVHGSDSKEAALQEIQIMFNH
jgi:nucleoside-diphosphate kinase